MADLLECLIQIKGVTDTPRRLTARLRARLGHGEPDALATDVVARLAMAEARFSACLSAMLADNRPSLTALDLTSLDVDPARSLSDWLEEFGRRRRLVVGLLERCSAEDLGRVGFEPSRGAMTVADVVALMLAHDTDQLGRLVRP